MNLHIWSHTSFSSYPPTKLTTNLPKQSSIHWHNCARGSESFGLEIIMAPSLDVALITTGWNPFSLIYKKNYSRLLVDSRTLSMCVWVSNAQRLLLANLSQLTNIHSMIVRKFQEKKSWKTKNCDDKNSTPTPWLTLLLVLGKKSC